MPTDPLTPRHPGAPARLEGDRGPAAVEKVLGTPQVAALVLDKLDDVERVRARLVSPDWRHGLSKPLQEAAGKMAERFQTRAPPPLSLTTVGESVTSPRGLRERSDDGTCHLTLGQSGKRLSVEGLWTGGGAAARNGTRTCEVDATTRVQLGWSLEQKKFWVHLSQPGVQESSYNHNYLYVVDFRADGVDVHKIEPAEGIEMMQLAMSPDAERFATLLPSAHVCIGEVAKPTQMVARKLDLPKDTVAVSLTWGGDSRALLVSRNGEPWAAFDVEGDILWPPSPSESTRLGARREGTWSDISHLQRDYIESPHFAPSPLSQCMADETRGADDGP